MKEDPKQKLLERVENDFTYHSAGNKQEQFVALREKAKELAILYVELVPFGREQATALTLLEQSNMMANAGIARVE